jgi:CheY-specific phosphatase CheX
LPNSPLLADYQSALLSAVTDVAENSLFTFADASSEAAFNATAAASDDDGWLSARLSFAGPIGGEFTLILPGALARRLGASFSGAESSDEIGDRDLVDFTGELANMVCGSWLTRACQHAAFNLTPPRVVRGAPGRPASTSVYLAMDDTPVRLDVDWAAGIGAAPPAAVEAADAR